MRRIINLRDKEVFLLQSEPSHDNFYKEYAVAAKARHIEKRKADYYSYVKRFLDILFSLALLPIALITIFVFAIVIKLDSRGSVFYKQERVGLHGKYFHIIKLRSMREDAEVNGAQWAEENDPRITRVGRFIRKTRIDELPQLFNVLKGDMSLIGPRPERPMFTAEFSYRLPSFPRRLSVKPGITGWAQVNGGYESTPKEKLEDDIYYIENKSFKLDIIIMIKTIGVLLTGNGAR